MADVHSKEVRSFNMSRIRSKDTKPEMIVRKYLHGQGFRYRLHVKDLPGKPDISLLKFHEKNLSPNNIRDLKATAFTKIALYF